MKIVFRSAAIAAFILTAASFGLAVAAPAAKADSFYFGYSDRDYGGKRYWKQHRRHNRHVVVVRRAPVYYAPPRRVIVVQQPAPVPVVVQAAPPVQVASDYCREYTETVTIAGQVHTAYGTVCLQPDGSWQKQ